MHTKEMCPRARKRGYVCHHSQTNALKRKLESKGSCRKNESAGNGLSPIDHFKSACTAPVGANPPRLKKKGSITGHAQKQNQAHAHTHRFRPSIR
eukprot:1193100-Prorocentrum_minimum.AAC.3